VNADGAGGLACAHRAGGAASEIGAGGGGDPFAAALARLEAAAQEVSRLASELRRALPDGRARAVQTLLDEAPEDLPTLAPWFFMLPAEQLREVWVPAVVHALTKRDTPPGLVAALSRVLTTVRVRLAPAKLDPRSPGAGVGSAAGAAGALHAGGDDDDDDGDGDDGDGPGERGEPLRRRSVASAAHVERTIARATATAARGQVLRRAGRGTYTPESVRSRIDAALAAAGERGAALVRFFDVFTAARSGKERTKINGLLRDLGYTVRPATADEVRAHGWPCRGRPPTVVERGCEC